MRGKGTLYLEARDKGHPKLQVQLVEIHKPYPSLNPAVLPNPNDAVRHDAD